MSEPPSAPGSSATAVPEPGGAAPGDATPYLLVMPVADGESSGVVWPGPEGKPAWAIPVTIPPGTRGFTVFVPLVQAAPSTPPSEAPAPAVQVDPAAPPARAEAAPPVTEAATSAPAASAPGAETGAGTQPPSAVDPSSSAAGSAEASSPTVPSPRSPETGTAPAPSAAATPAAVAPPPPPVPAPNWGGTPAYGQMGSVRPYPSRPVPPSFLQTRWPGPKPGKGWLVPAAVLAGALGQAFFVPLSRVGIGWLLGWLTLTVGVVFAVRRPVAELPRAERWIRAGWAAAALALLSVLAFRNAWWLVTFCVLGALACAALAIVGGRLLRSILFSLVAAPFAAFRGLPWVRQHARAGTNPGLARRITWSVAATAVVLIVFGALLSSADVAFSAVLAEFVPEINVGTVFRWIFLLAVGGLIAVAAVYTLSAPPDLSTVDSSSGRRLGIVEWMPAIAGLTLLFGGFVAVQFTVLFGGQRHVLRTTGLSYAEYARSGFWQLLAVTLLTLAVLGGVTRWARRDRAIERILLRTLLGLLSALSVVIVVSALSRMYTYQKVYSFTGERIFVMAFELLLGAVFLMILVAGIRWRGAWIPRLTVGLAVVMLLSLAAINPEDYVARRNIARYQETGRIDAWYLRALSADATPALAKLPDPVRRCTLSWIADELEEPDPWNAWNLGRVRARNVLDRLGPDAIGGQRDCRAADQFDLPKTRPPR
ncbi:DUF4153 domain-containing protein [Plantactinospora sp. CA-290183]|uniref:DUF4153 domain-containing protein n=1 Tax=Plantactinospora sp. CA-290183 TaxID=3240006 RepID=UPI003D9388D6